MKDLIYCAFKMKKDNKEFYSPISYSLKGIMKSLSLQKFKEFLNFCKETEKECQELCDKLNQEIK